MVTNYANITGDVTKRTVTVTTNTIHGLRSNHFVDIDVNPSFATTYVVKYNDRHRRIVGIETFSVQVLIVLLILLTYLITVMVNSTPTSCGGLENDKIYYIVKVDNDNIKLSNTHQDQPSYVVGITSTSFGEFAESILLLTLRSSTLNFDVSDSSLDFLTIY